MRNNYCFSKIQPVGQKNIETKHLSQVKARPYPLPLKHYKYDGRFSLLVGYNKLKIKVVNVAESAKIVTNVQTFRDCALHQRNVR